MKGESGLEKFLVNREELNQRYKSPKYKHLKYTAFGFFVACIIMYAIMIIAMDNMSDWWFLFLRGCAGALALVGVIIYVVYVYRINRDYERDKYIRRKVSQDEEDNKTEDISL